MSNSPVAVDSAPDIVQTFYAASVTMSAGIQTLSAASNWASTTRSMAAAIKSPLTKLLIVVSVAQSLMSAQIQAAAIL